MEFFFGLIVFGLIVFLFVRYLVLKNVDHARYNEEDLDKNATIVNVESKLVGSKGGTRFKTIVTFSDGYKYISHDTIVEKHFFFYNMKLTPEMRNEIIERAKKEHFILADPEGYHAKLQTEKATMDKLQEMLDDVPLKENDIKCPFCGKVQSREIKRCLRCGELIIND